jgi:hypothetical protein
MPAAVPVAAAAAGPLAAIRADLAPRCAAGASAGLAPRTDEPPRHCELMPPLLRPVPGLGHGVRRTFTATA